MKIAFSKPVYNAMCHNCILFSNVVRDSLPCLSEYHANKKTHKQSRVCSQFISPVLQCDTFIFENTIMQNQKPSSSTIFYSKTQWKFPNWFKTYKYVTSKRQNHEKIAQIFVAFSEKLNFKIHILQDWRIRLGSPIVFAQWPTLFCALFSSRNRTWLYYENVNGRETIFNKI